MIIFFAHTCTRISVLNGFFKSFSSLVKLVYMKAEPRASFCLHTIMGSEARAVLFSAAVYFSHAYCCVRSPFPLNLDLFFLLMVQ